MPPIKIIATDLDSTLLTSDKRISELNQATLISKQQEGYTVVIATGRYEREVTRYAKQLELAKYNGYMICVNGYEVVACATNTRHHFSKINKEETIQLIQLARKHRLVQFVRIDETYYLSLNKFQKSLVLFTKNIIKFLVKGGLKRGNYAVHLLEETAFQKDLVPLIDQGCIKFCVIGTKKQLARYQQALSVAYPESYAYYPVNSLSLEITKSDVSKKHAVEYVAQQLGYDLSNVMALGDSGNDLPLLKAAGIGVTMCNGTDFALSQAKHVSEYSNNQDGVAHEIKKRIS